MEGCVCFTGQRDLSAAACSSITPQTSFQLLQLSLEGFKFPVWERSWVLSVGFCGQRDVSAAACDSIDLHRSGFRGLLVSFVDLVEGWEKCRGIH